MLCSTCNKAKAYYIIALESYCSGEYSESRSHPNCLTPLIAILTERLCINNVYIIIVLPGVDVLRPLSKQMAVRLAC